MFSTKMRIHPGVRWILPLLVTLVAGVEITRADAAQGPDEGTLLVRFSPVVRGVMADFVAARHGAVVEARNLVLNYTKLRVAPGQSIESALAGLRAEATVEWAEENGFYTAIGVNDIPQDPMLLALEDQLATHQNQWGVFRTGLPWLWRQGAAPGAGVIVAVIDTGIDNFTSPHADLAANIHATGRDFIDDDNTPTDVGNGAALYGHGTHVAGIVAAVPNTQGIAGVAYGAKVMVIRVLDCNAGNQCPGSYSDLADGIQFAADNGARVINLSLGGQTPSLAVRTAVQYAIGKGSVVVAAAGNDSTHLILRYPAQYSEVIAVGASDSLDHVPTFSNYGPSLDLVAPGVKVWSTVPGGGYAAFSGTSQASPFVAGVAAILVGRNAAIKALEVERYLYSHAFGLQGADAIADGAGRVAYIPLEDWSDLPPPYTAARHKNFLWEWLGKDVSAELSIADAADLDFRPNIGAPQAADGHDQGVFPGSFPRLPFLPPHVGTPTSTLDFGLSVSRWDGPRYAADAAHSLHLDTWIDWDSDGVFEEVGSEHVVSDYTENPATWGANTKLVSRSFAPLDKHLLGNPLAIRTRLNYGASVGSAIAEAKFGEVEDDHMVNFVEDFDLAPDVFTVTDSWSFGVDPGPGPCTHHGAGQFGRSTHPAIGAPCNGFIERINYMATPEMNWEEFTKASVRFWYCHSANPCVPNADFCKFVIDANGVKTILGFIPTGVGVIDVDVSDFVGHDVVRIEFVEETDQNGYLLIDDITVVAYDDEKPAAVTTLVAFPRSGEKFVELALEAPIENDVVASPPADGQASIYDLRYASTPITTDADWDSALRFDPRDLASGASSLTPAVNGSVQLMTLTAPSAFQSYSFALRSQDEVNNVSPLSNSTTSAGAPTLGVTVLPLGSAQGAAGDTVIVPSNVANSGTTPDSYAITGQSTLGWTLVDLPDLVTLDEGANQTFNLRVVIPITATAGQVDSVTLIATSLADPNVEGSAVSTVLVALDPASIGETAGVVRVDDLRVTSQNPIHSRVDLELDLVARTSVSVKVYNAEGRLVRSLVDGDLQPGRHALMWDTFDQSAKRVASGLYFVDARIGNERVSRRLVMLR